MYAYGNAYCADRTAAVISFENWKGQIDGEKCNRKKRNRQIRVYREQIAPGKLFQNLFIPFFMTVLP